MSASEPQANRHTAILVLGAGELGMAVLRNLSQRAQASTKVSITVLLRPETIASQDPGKQREVAEIRSLGVGILAGDLVAGTEAELAASFADFDTVIGCTGFVAGRGTQRKLARAALRAGVQRYFPWQFGVDYDVIGRGSAQDLFDEQLDVRDLLRAQTHTAWVIVSTGMFTSFLFDPGFGVVDLAANTVHALGSWDTEVTVTTPEDIGVATAEILFAEPRIANQVVHVAGDTITYARLADIVDEVTDRRVQRVAWPVPQLREALAHDPGDSLKKYRAVFAAGKGVAWDKQQSFNAQRGLDFTSAADWARANLRS